MELTTDLVVEARRSLDVAGLGKLDASAQILGEWYKRLGECMLKSPNPLRDHPTKWHVAVIARLACRTASSARLPKFVAECLVDMSRAFSQCTKAARMMIVSRFMIAAIEEVSPIDLLLDDSSEESGDMQEIDEAQRGPRAGLNKCDYTDDPLARSGFNEALIGNLLDAARRCLGAVDEIEDMICLADLLAIKADLLNAYFRIQERFTPLLAGGDIFLSNAPLSLSCESGAQILGSQSGSTVFDIPLDSFDRLSSSDAAALHRHESALRRHLTNWLLFGALEICLFVVELYLKESDTPRFCPSDRTIGQNYLREGPDAHPCPELKLFLDAFLENHSAILRLSSHLFDSPRRVGERLNAAFSGSQPRYGSGTLAETSHSELCWNRNHAQRVMHYARAMIGGKRETAFMFDSEPSDGASYAERDLPGSVRLALLILPRMLDICSKVPGCGQTRDTSAYASVKPSLRRQDSRAFLEHCSRTELETTCGIFTVTATILEHMLSVYEDAGGGSEGGIPIRGQHKSWKAASGQSSGGQIEALAEARSLSDQNSIQSGAVEVSNASQKLSSVSHNGGSNVGGMEGMIAGECSTEEMVGGRERMKELAGCDERGVIGLKREKLIDLFFYSFFFIKMNRIFLIYFFDFFDLSVSLESEVVRTQHNLLSSKIEALTYTLSRLFNPIWDQLGPSFAPLANYTAQNLAVMPHFGIAVDANALNNDVSKRSAKPLLTSSFIVPGSDAIAGEDRQHVGIWEFHKDGPRRDRQYTTYAHFGPLRAFSNSNLAPDLVPQPKPLRVKWRRVTANQENLRPAMQREIADSASHTQHTNPAGIWPLVPVTPADVKEDCRSSMVFFNEIEAACLSGLCSDDLHMRSGACFVVCYMKYGLFNSHMWCEFVNFFQDLAKRQAISVVQQWLALRNSVESALQNGEDEGELQFELSMLREGEHTSLSGLTQVAVSPSDVEVAFYLSQIFRIKDEVSIEDDMLCLGLAIRLPSAKAGLMAASPVIERLGHTLGDEPVYMTLFGGGENRFEASVWNIGGTGQGASAAMHEEEALLSSNPEPGKPSFSAHTLLLIEALKEKDILGAVLKLLLAGYDLTDEVCMKGLFLRGSARLACELSLGEARELLDQRICPSLGGILQDLANEDGMIQDYNPLVDDVISLYTAAVRVTLMDPNGRESRRTELAELIRRLPDTYDAKEFLQRVEAAVPW